MCGISGIFVKEGQRIEDSKIEAMTRVLAHRGPDGEGTYFDKNIGLGHRRLSIFDLSECGRQPMESHDGRYTIVQNGEVYNWPEIREQLAFNNWRSQTDSETILYAFIEKGIDCLKDFNGMFGFAIWDKQERELFLVRDRIGIKPLFYGYHNNEFYFASELKSFFAGGFPKKVNYSAVYDFLRWGGIDHSEYTFYENILSLKAGHYLRVKDGRIQDESCYWNLAQSVHMNPAVEYPDIVDEYSKLFKDAIDLRLRSDVPVGVFLSGGVDSSILTARLANKLGPDRLQAYTYEFDTAGHGEGEYAREVADWLGIKNHTVALASKDIPSYFEKALYHQEMPVTSIRCLASQKLFEKVKSTGTTVILEGHGGDHIGGGFEYYFVPYVLDIARQQGFDEALRLLNQFMSLYSVTEDKVLRKFFNCLAASQQPGIATQDGITFLKLNCFDEEFIQTEDLARVNYERPFKENLLNAQYIDLRHHNLPRVLRYTDRESMASGCESRVPLLDHRIVELAFRSRLNARVQGTQQRFFMREAEASFLPEHILKRPKRSIVDPQRRWLQHELKDWVLDLFHSKEFGERGIFNQAQVISEYERYCLEDKPVTGFHIFQYINIEMWFRTMIDKEVELEQLAVST